MGYGSRAVELLHRYYNGEIIRLGGNETDSDIDDDDVSMDSDTRHANNGNHKNTSDAAIPVPRKDVPPLLVPLESAPPPRLDWLGTSCGLTEPLYKFWSVKAGMRLLYLRQTSNELTGEYSAIFVKSLPRRSGFDDGWLYAFEADVQRRLVSLLGGPFMKLPVSLATSLLRTNAASASASGVNNNNGASIDFSEDVTSAIAKRSGSSALMKRMTAAEVSQHLTPHDMARIELYSRNLCDYHLVTDLLPTLGRLFFSNRLGDVALSQLQAGMLYLVHTNRLFLY